jgi:hypothetical protein
MPSKLRIFLVCTIAVIIAGSLAAETFRNPYRIPLGVDPAGVVGGDLNGDGLPDITWVDESHTPFELHILLAQSGGGYLPAGSLSLPVGSGTNGCLLSDVNRDGHLDLVCTAPNGLNDTIEVFLGNGDGTFQAPISTTIPKSNPYIEGDADPFIFPAGDLDGDGFPDFFKIDPENDDNQTLLSDGKGSFKPAIAGPSFIEPSGEVLGISYGSPTFADVNGDGKIDLLWSNGPEVALGNGDGSFQTIYNYAAGALCTFHDMDGDSHLDAVCGSALTSGGQLSGATQLTILPGNPDGSFNVNPIAQKVFGNDDNALDGVGTFDNPIAVYDFNGDGIPDILAQSGDGFAVLLGGPGLTYSTPLHYAQALVDYGYRSGSFLSQSQIIDMNNDGHPDVLACGPNGIYISYGESDGSFSSALAPEVTELIGYATVVDFNGDGIPDVAATRDSAIKLSLGKGDGTFAAPIALPNSSGSVNFSIATNGHIVHGDFNGDGIQDLLAIGSPGMNQGDSSYILFGHGDGTFSDPVPVPTSSMTFPEYTGPNDDAVTDINHDGRSDVLGLAIIVNTPQPQITFSLSKGDGTFTPVATSIPIDSGDSNGSTDIPSPATFPALADFSQSGQLDAVYGSYINAYVLKGHGDGSFDSTGIMLPIPQVSGQSSYGSLSVATGDFDGDGNQDFVLLAQYGAAFFADPQAFSTAAWVYFGDGKGNFSTPVLAGTFDHNYIAVAATDLNRDGLADIILRSNDAPGGWYVVGIVNAQAGRTFGPEINYTAGTGLSSLSIADLNNDGFPDLVFANGDLNIEASSVTVLLNLGNVVSVAETLTSMPNPSAIGQAFNITATLAAPNAGTVTGPVTFSIDGTRLGSSTLSNDAATIAGPTTLTAGIHQLSATWLGNSTYPPITLTATHTVAALPLTLILGSNINPSALTQTVTFATAFSATPTPSESTLTGTLSFYDGTTLLTQQQPSTAGDAFSTAALSIGTHPITAVYSGDSTFAAATSNVVQQVVNGLPTTTTVAVNPNPSTYGQPVVLTTHVAPVTPNKLIPTGQVVLTFCRGAQITLPLDANGNGSIDYPFGTAIADPVGSCAFTGLYSGDGTFNPSTSASVTEVVNPAPSTTTIVSAAANPAYVSQPVTFTVQVTGTPSPTADPVTGQPIPPGALQFSGTVQLFDGTSPIASAPVTVINATTGQAVVTISSLAVGSHIITAAYSNDPNLGGSTSPPVTEVINPAPPADFTFTGPTSITFQTEAAGTGTLTLASLNGFRGPITLTCNPPLPANYLCTLAPATPSLAANATASSTITLQPNLTSSATPHSTRIVLATLFPLALLAFARRRRHRFTALLTFALLAILTTAVTGCGPDIYYAATPPGTYPITVTATGATQGSSSPATHTLSLNVVITR